MRKLSMLHYVQSAENERENTFLLHLPSAY